MTAPRSGWLALNHAATIFVSAFLLFQIQPLVTKYILPWFGGSPAVWTTCMLFFQSLLFGGYAYAHFSTLFLKPRQQAVVHGALIVLAIALLRVIPGDSWKPEDSTAPVGQIIMLLGATIGLPYFVLSSTGPLVQAWFARSFPGRIPYRLYALSNFGSLLALLSYPFVFERIFDLPHQAEFWRWGFVLYGVLCGLAAFNLWRMFRHPASAPVDTAASQAADSAESSNPHAIPLEASAASPRWWHVILWLVLPTFGSIVLLSTTNHVCTDVAVIPFLWVVPLSLYLITFIVAFDHPRWYKRTATALFTMSAIYLVGIIHYGGQGKIDLSKEGTPAKVAQYLTRQPLPGAEPQIVPIEYRVSFPVYIGFNFAAMFGICMLCHGELVRLRPHPRYLTAYYLMLSAGGALGGVTITFYAPRLFYTYYEFNLSLLAGFAMGAAFVFQSIARFVVSRPRETQGRALSWFGPLVAAPAMLIAGLGFYDLLIYLERPPEAELRARNFFGTLSVKERAADDPWSHDHVFHHGVILHGAQYVNPERRHLPITYYLPEGGIGRTVGYFRQSRDIPSMRIGTVGLGVGTMAAFVGPQDYICFYEINPAVIAITLSGKFFTYVTDCLGKKDVLLGDARLTMERQLREGQPQHYHVIVLDAFSGDAIPIHLLTEEAFETYVDHLATPENGGQHGAIAINVTNRYVDLVPLVHGLAERFGLECVFIWSGNDQANNIYEAHWMILTRNPELVKELRKHEFKSDKPPRAPILWTDAKSNLFEVLKW